MTRLQSSDIQDMSASLVAFDDQLRRQTGHDLLGVAAHAVGYDLHALKGRLSPPRVGVICMTCGQGAIPGFAQTVASIVDHLGGLAFVAGSPDAAGLAEACEQEADIVMLSDDTRFVAINLERRTVADNSVMTGKGFAAALDLMAGGLKSHSALILGCGPVGRAATATLTDFGARVTVFDPNTDRSRALADDCLQTTGQSIEIAPDLSSALGQYRYILDATPAGAFIPEDVLVPASRIAAPGVPCGATSAAEAQLGDRLLFDPLRIGVASMLLKALQTTRRLA
mgnify:CR=1 FL=1